MTKAALFILCFTWYASAVFGVEGRESKEIIMGYNTSAKNPLVAAAPDNSGAYIDLYTRAARKIGYRLKIVRYPKKRVYLMMKEGKIDFYPGMKYKEDRAAFAYFIPNGLPTGRTGVSRMDMPEITDLSQLRGKRIVMPFDGIDYTNGTNDILISRVRKLDMQKAYKLLINKRVDFYATDDVVVAAFLKENNINDVRIHPNFLPTTMMTLGFSRSSPYFKADKNRFYDPDREPGIENDPSVLEKESVAYKLQGALLEMIKEGEVDTIYNLYFTLE